MVIKSNGAKGIVTGALARVVDAAVGFVKGEGTKIKLKETVPASKKLTINKTIFSSHHSEATLQQQ